MGSNSASAGGSDAGFENTKKSKVSTLTKLKLKTKPVIATVIGGLTKGEEVNRKFFEEKVKPAGKSKYNTYEDYIRARGRGEVDAYGREISQSDNGGNNQPAQETIIKKNIGGSEVQTTQAKIDEQRAKSDEYDVRKVKKEGRKRYTLTSSKGVTQVSDDYSLGKKSLLGTV